MKKYRLHKIDFSEFSNLKEINIISAEILLKVKKNQKIESYKFKMKRYLPQKYEVKIRKDFQIQEVSYLINNKIRVETENKKQKIFNLDEDNRIVVLATMSSGKSTFLNALLGEEILPSENQACTGKIFEVSNNESKRGKLEIFKRGNLIEEKSIVESDLKLLNIDSEIEKIIVNTEFQNIKRKIVIYDTPGVNNSIDENHYKITYEFLEKNEIKNYIYIF